MTPDDRITYDIDETPFARGWPPLLDWLRTNGIDPSVVRAVTYTAGRAHLVEYDLDAQGRRTWRKTPRGVTPNELLTKTRAVAVTTPIPIHPNYHQRTLPL